VFDECGVLRGEEVSMKLGAVKSIWKDNNGKVSGDFLHARIEHDVKKPIKRWGACSGERGKGDKTL
jgi:hypothetical protein